MRITLGGTYRIYEFGDAIDRMLQNFSANGVEKISRINIYANLDREGRAIILNGPDGKPIEHLRFDGPSEREFRPITQNVSIISPALDDEPAGQPDTSKSSSTYGNKI